MELLVRKKNSPLQRKRTKEAKQKKPFLLGLKMKKRSHRHERKLSIFLLQKESNKKKKRPTMSQQKRIG